MFAVYNMYNQPVGPRVPLLIDFLMQHLETSLTAQRLAGMNSSRKTASQNTDVQLFCCLNTDFHEKLSHSWAIAEPWLLLCLCACTCTSGCTKGRERHVKCASSWELEINKSKEGIPSFERAVPVHLGFSKEFWFHGQLRHRDRQIDTRNQNCVTP